MKHGIQRLLLSIVAVAALWLVPYAIHEVLTPRPSISNEKAKADFVQFFSKGSDSMNLFVSEKNFHRDEVVDSLELYVLDIDPCAGEDINGVAIEGYLAEVKSHTANRRYEKEFLLVYTKGSDKILKSVLVNNRDNWKAWPR